jgi:hypothetical protein
MKRSLTFLFYSCIEAHGTGCNHLTRTFIPRGNPMTEEQEKKDKKEACIMHHADAAGDPNLCCCYIIDSEGRFEDPCYHPVSGCC